MLKAVRDTFPGIVRNWPMVVIAVVAIALGIHDFSERDWLRLIAMSLTVIGACANIAVMAINGGRMPVQSADAIRLESAAEHQLMNSETRLAFLGDWIKVRDWLLSPGDICLYAGLILFVVNRAFGRILS